MSFRRTAASALAAVFITSVPAGALPAIDIRTERVVPLVKAEAEPTGPVLRPYRALGTWVDMYNPGM